MQEFQESIDFELDLHDFSGKEDPHEKALDWMKGEFGRPFELYDRPLFRYALIKISNNRHYWFQKYHHLIVDGWASSILVHRVERLYDAIHEGE